MVVGRLGHGHRGTLVCAIVASLAAPALRDGRAAEPEGAVASRAAPAVTAPRFAGRELQDVLDELRGAGLPLIYSSDLVHRGMKVKDEPRSREPRAALHDVLEPHGLRASPGPGGTLVVVKGAAEPLPASASDDPLRLGFRDRADVPAGSPPETVAAGTLRFGAREVLGMPGAVDNVFRALQVVPGITGAGLYESKIAVRGGSPDQNLTVMDGVEIHNPFRLFGAVAGFNPDTVARFELVAGAFPAEYGDRLSSLLIVDTRDGRRDGHLSGSAAASATDASAVLEGALPGPGDGSWLFASRRTYYDLVAERFLGDGLPSFDDLQLKLAWRGAGGRRLALCGWRSRERSNGDWSDAADTILVGSQGANDLLAANFTLPLGRRLAWRGVVSAYRFDESLDLDVEGRSDTRVSFGPRPNPTSPARKSDQVLTLALDRQVGVDDLALRQVLDLAPAPLHRLQVGGEVHWLRTRWRQEVPADRNPEAANGSSILFGAGLPDLVDSTFDSTRAAAFVQYQGRLAGRLLLAAGLRLERRDAGERFVLSPRLNATWDLGASMRLKAGAGLHAQGPGYEKLLHSDYFLDLSKESRAGLGEERALHLLLGLSGRISPDVEWSLEGYYRDFDNLLVGRLETPAENAARLSGYDFPAELGWALPRDPLITSHPASDGTGRAFGVITSASRANRPGRRVHGFVGYAWGVSERTAYGRTFPSDYDRPHSLTAAGFLRLSTRLELGLTARVASGLPTTPPRGVLVLGARDTADRDGDGDRDELVPARDENGRLIYVADPGGAATRNASRLPTYARLDARLTYAPRGPAGRWLFYLEAINVTNRTNASSYDWDIRLDPGATRPRIETSGGQDGIPFLPTVGVRVRF